jgi:trigger factor
MNIEIDSRGSFTRDVRVTVASTDVGSELDKAFNQIRRRVRLPGFRQGKAPRRVLEDRFGAQVRDDVASTFIQNGWTQALGELEVVGRPEVTDRGDIKKGSDFAFTISVDVKPSIELTQFKGLDVVYPKWEVSDDEVGNSVQGRLQGAARLVAIDDRPVETGDVAMVAIRVTEGDEELANEPGTLIQTSGDDYYAGVEELLIGLSIGEDASGKITFAETAKNAAVAGKEADVSVKIEGIQANQVPELTDDVANELGYEGGIQGMREALRAQIGEGREEMARNQARANLLESLIAANSFEVPPGMVDSNLEMLKDELRYQQQLMGRDPRQMSFSGQQLAELRSRAGFAAKAALILEAVWTAEKIEVNDADVDRKVGELAAQRGQTVEAVRGWFAKEDQMSELKDRLLEEKTLDWLLEGSNLVDAPEPEPESEPTAETEAEAPAAAPAPKTSDAAVDLSVLAQAVGKLKTALGTGEHDAHLDALLDAETTGKARKGAISAIKSRQKASA